MTNEEKIARLVSFINSCGSWQEQYFENSDYANNFLVCIHEQVNFDESIAGSNFIAVWNRIPENKKKEAWEWCRQNATASFQYLGSPGNHCSDDACSSILCDGEEEVGLANISGEVDGKEVLCQFSALLEGLSETDIEKVSRQIDYCWFGSPSLYVDRGYSIISFCVDLEEFEKLFVEVEEEGEEGDC